MKHLPLEGQKSVVRDFVMSLTVDQAETVLELNGQAVACVVPLPHRNGNEKSAWNDAKNERRCELIDRKYDGKLNAEEAAELALLQEEALQYRQRVAPFPLNAARRLHQKLLLKAKKRPSS
jgi:hypothetical protein